MRSEKVKNYFCKCGYELFSNIHLDIPNTNLVAEIRLCCPKCGKMSSFTFRNLEGEPYYSVAELEKIRTSFKYVEHNMLTRKHFFDNDFIHFLKDKKTVEEILK